MGVSRNVYTFFVGNPKRSIGLRGRIIYIMER
jgi:hypothetical protein